MNNSNHHVLSHRDRDCQKIKKAFTDAFISKDPCSAREEDYDLLMKLGHQTVPCDKVSVSSCGFNPEGKSQREHDGR